MLLLVSAALAQSGPYTAPSQDVELYDETDIFQAVTYSTGWVPGGSPLAVSFNIFTDGGAYVFMEGESWLQWPPFEHGYAPSEGTGEFLLDQELGISVDFRLDIGGVVWEDTLYSTSSIFQAESFFDPWRLAEPDALESEWVVADASTTQDELFRFEQDVVTALSVFVSVDWRQDAQAGFRGVRFTTNDDLLIEFEDQTQVPEVPDNGVLELETVFTGEYYGTMDLVLIPTLGACIDLIGCFDVIAFDLPIPLIDALYEEDFEPVYLEHGVPLLVPADMVCDFGEVEVGQVATCQVPLENLGAMELEGSAGILGAGEFTVYPEEVYAGAPGTDGLTVTFAPTAEGEQASDLVLNTNDPWSPAWEIELSGVGVVEEIPVTVISTEVGNCGCGSTPRTGHLAWLAPLAGVLFFRRRRT